MITIQLTEEDALLFKAFREHQDNFAMMVASGVFNIRGGSATLHLNLEGVVDSVDAKIDIYRRGHKQLQYVSLTKLQHKREVEGSGKQRA